MMTKVFHFPYLQEPIKAEDLCHFQDPLSRLRTSPIYPHTSPSPSPLLRLPTHSSPSAYPISPPHSTHHSSASPFDISPFSTTGNPPPQLPLPSALQPNSPPPPPPPPPSDPTWSLSKPVPAPNPKTTTRTPPEYEALVIKELQTRLKDSHKVVSHPTRYSNGGSDLYASQVPTLPP